MAKWGEGDPRWIVEERPDSTNVNNWHWTEFNCTAWAHNYLQNSLGSFSAQDNAIEVRVTKLDDLQGTVTITNRKGKVKFYYELSFTLEWEGDTDSTNGRGTIKVTDLTQDDQLEDYTVDIMVNEGSNERRAFTNTINKFLLPRLRDKMAEFNATILREYGPKVLLPTKEQVVAAQKAENDAAAARKAAAAAADAAANATDGKPSSVRSKTLRMEVDFLASANDIFDALTDANRVQIWTQAPAQISPEPNTDFALFGGNVTGKMLEAERGQKIKQSWRLSHWPSGHTSTVTMTFAQGTSSTLLKMTQQNVPEDQFEATQQNWTSYYFDRMKGVFGWGVLSFHE